MELRRKVALLYSGSAYNVKFSLPTQLKNLVEPNDADVFVFTTKLCKRRKTEHSEYIPDASENDKWNEKVANTLLDEHNLRQSEIQLIKETFGERLKGFKIAEEDTEYMDYLASERQLMMETINRYIDESIFLNLPAPFRGIKLTSSNNQASNGTLRCVIDQYRHIKKCYEMMEEYERQGNFKYEWVMRARIDFIVPFVFNLKHYYENQDKPYVYICGSFRQEVMSWMDEHTWFSKRITAEKLFPNLDKMGLIRSRNHNTIQYGTEYSGTLGNDLIFDPEVQFSLFLYEIGLNDLINVKIYRSARYTNDGEYDYFNYEFQRAAIDLEHEFNLVKNYETDINEHAETLRYYSSQSELVCEAGVRFGNSTIMLMAGRPKKMLSFDVHREARVDYLELIAKDCDINWEFILKNPTPEDSNESLLPNDVDLLMLDTNHTGTQIGMELNRHAHKVRKWIIMHDTTTFGTRGMGDENIWDGMNAAIETFLKEHINEWRIKEKFTYNNGLTVLERINYFE